MCFVFFLHAFYSGISWRPKQDKMNDGFATAENFGACTLAEESAPITSGGLR